MAEFKHFQLIVKKNYEDQQSVRSLQILCRSALLQYLTLERAQQIADLPIPSVVKSFLCTFRIPGDFDLAGLFINYNFCFPNHVHHKTHQIHPAKYVHGGHNVLIKYLSTKDKCSKCSVWGNHTMVSENEREIWLCLKHENLMNCLVAMMDPEKGVFCCVLEFPVVNLQDFSWKLYCAKVQAPEYFVWQILLKLSSVLMFLEKHNVSPWELCQPHHVMIDEKGEIKLENKLLYLPLNGGMNFHTEYNALTLYLSPEQKSGQTKGPKTTVWGLGSILFELTSTIPSILIASFGINGWRLLPFASTNRSYSADLKHVISQCRSRKPNARPSIEQLKSLADEKLKQTENHYGDKSCSLLDLLPDKSDIATNFVI